MVFGTALAVVLVAAATAMLCWHTATPDAYHRQAVVLRYGAMIGSLLESESPLSIHELSQACEELNSTISGRHFVLRQTNSSTSHSAFGLVAIEDGAAGKRKVTILDLQGCYAFAIEKNGRTDVPWDEAKASMNRDGSRRLWLAWE